MNKTGFVALVVAIGGCALTPQELSQSTKPTRHEMALTAEAAAKCIAANVENAAAAYTPTVRSVNAREWQVVVRVPRAENTTALLAHVIPSGRSSAALVWTTPYSTGDLRKTALKGC